MIELIFFIICISEQMPRKRKTRHKGRGPAWDWIKKAARTVHDFVKDKKLISRGAAAIAPSAGPYAGAISKAGTVAGTLG